MFHIVIHIFFFVLHFVLGIFERLTNEGVNNSLLLFGKSIEDILNCFFLRCFLRFFLHPFLRSSVFDLLFFFIRFISHFFHILLLWFGMLQGFIFFSIVMDHNILIIANNKALFGVFTVNHNRINECTGISTGHHNTYFSNNTMQNFITGLLKFISINRQGFNITMPNCFFCCLPRFAIIEGAICIHTFVTILEQCMTENIVGVAVIVVINQRNGLSVIALERIFTNNSTVSAQEIVPRGPATEIILLHFDSSSFIQ